MQEIERKFFVPKLPDALRQRRGAAIEQGYLAVAKEAEVRIRQRGQRHFLTVKHKGGLAREEIEVQISSRQFAALWPATRGARLKKRRIEVQLGSLTAEVDVYGGPLRGLVVAEVEFTTERAAKEFSPPAWFGREVTKDPRYRNQTLATSRQKPDR